MSLIVDKMYKLGHRPSCPRAFSKQFHEIYSHQFCNDNVILNILYGLDNIDPSKGLPNLQDINANTKYAEPEYKAVIESLSRKFPAAGFVNDETAFEFIRSRYHQFGEELDLYASDLLKIADDAKSQLDLSQQSPEPVTSE